MFACVSGEYKSMCVRVSMWSPEDNLQSCSAGPIHLVFETGALAGQNFTK